MAASVQVHASADKTLASDGAKNGKDSGQNNATKLVRVSLNGGGAVVSHCCCWTTPAENSQVKDTQTQSVAINLVCEDFGLPTTTTTITAEDDQGSQVSCSNSLEEVRTNFRRLLGHNKVQYFYLGTLIYSVISILHLTRLDFLAAPQLVLTLALALTMAKTTLHFGHTQVRDKSVREPSLVRAIGLASSLALLHLPLFRHLLNLNPGPSMASSLSVGPILGLLYLLPGQLECNLIIQLLATLSPLAELSIMLHRHWSSSSSTTSLLLLAPLFLLLGHSRRLRWHEQVVCKALDGARRLIEAKVSLEHQRQQQETLLLSVLPAYVAEQVKRNMLKKTTEGGASVGLEELGSDSQPPQPPPPNVTVPTINQANNTNEEPVTRGSARNSFLLPSWRLASSHNHLSAGSAPTVAAPTSANQAARRGFNELYIRTYNNVSLLYGDIVGFTQLCSQLSSWQLVRVLNDLFSHFDRLAERHRIMRIKILGDCYYGVSGIPEFAVMGAKSRATRNDNHACNCVNMGLDMIHYIRRLNVERSSPVQAKQVGAQADNQPPCLPQFELNMRIGIHTGHIHSGVIGLKKWQFDVWSNDVSIAMHCESSGVAGRIQVTQATVQQLQNAFTYERAEGGERDPFLASKEIKTYLIKDNRTGSSDLIQQLTSNDQQQRSPQQQPGRKFSATQEATALGETDKIRAATIGTIREILLAGDTFNSSQHNSYGLAFNHHDLKPFTLNYRDPAIGRLYARCPITQLVRELSILVLLASLCLTLIARRHLATNLYRQQLLSFAVLLLMFLLLVVTILNLLLSGEPFRRFRKKVEENVEDLSYQQDFQQDEYQTNPNQQQVGLDNKESKKNTWLQLTTSHLRRLACWINNKRRHSLISAHHHHDDTGGARWRLLASSLLLIAVASIHAHLLLQHFCPGQVALHGGKVHSEELILNNISSDQLTVILALVAIDSSTQLVDHLTKCLLLLSLIILHLLLALKPLFLALLSNLADQTWLMIAQHCDLQNSSKTSLVITTPLLSSALLLVFILWSWAYGRQLEYTNKANFLWRNRLNVDHEELEYISGINKVLLENILPSHVVQYYLTHPNEQPKSQLLANNSGQPYMRMSFSNIRNLNSSNELYHEQHDSVAVMFASIPHFYEFYDESDINKQGLGCIALLNEIICDFDKLLLKNKFSRIEKIKTIGSTYMAAAGLRPCNLTGARNSTASQVSITCSSATSPVSKTTITKSGTQQQRLWLDIQATGSLELNDERRQVMSQQKLNLICMIQFATSLMSALNGINKQSFQVFKLRVGVNAGPVVAGVIGAQRPFYDIWGDCVNIASRMESLGEVGRIQVEEQTAKLLMESLCTENYSIVKRGHIDVKGKGGMVTYFVDKKPPTTTFLVNSNNNPVSAPILHQEQDSHPFGKMHLPINQLQRVASQGRQQQVEEEDAFNS